jgi:beta-glucanase (GH16 family)
MKIYALILPALIWIAPMINSRPLVPDSHYKLVWSDDFSGNTLDSTKWTYRTGKRFLSTQLPENVSVADGDLVISLRGDKNHTYTSGGIISRQTFRYGYYEARLKLPTASGWHSSFWMMRNTEPGSVPDGATIELDALENLSSKLNSYEVNVHRWTPPHIAHGGMPVKTDDLSANFHVIGCEYAPDVISYYLDGNLVATVDWKGKPQGDVNVWLTSVAQAMGPQHDVDESALPSKMLVDWVRVYVKEPSVQ